MRMAPPGRASSSQTGLVKLRGPHHWATCCGSIHMRNTSSRGASKTCVMVSSRAATGLVLANAIIRSSFHFCQMLLKAIEGAGPAALMALPLLDGLERFVAEGHQRFAVPIRERHGD